MEETDQMLEEFVLMLEESDQMEEINQMVGANEDGSQSRVVVEGTCSGGLKRESSVPLEDLLKRYPSLGCQQSSIDRDLHKLLSGRMSGLTNDSNGSNGEGADDEPQHVMPEAQPSTAPKASEAPSAVASGVVSTARAVKSAGPGSSRRRKLRTPPPPPPIPSSGESSRRESEEFHGG